MLKIALMLGLGVTAILIPQAASAGQGIRTENGYYDFQLVESPRSLAATKKSRPSVGTTRRPIRR
jgi:hypothetical protein